MKQLYLLLLGFVLLHIFASWPTASGHDDDDDDDDRRGSGDDNESQEREYDEDEEYVNSAHLTQIMEWELRSIVNLNVIKSGIFSRVINYTGMYLKSATLSSFLGHMYALYKSYGWKYSWHYVQSYVVYTWSPYVAMSVFYVFGIRGCLFPLLDVDHPSHTLFGEYKASIIVTNIILICVFCGLFHKRKRVLKAGYYKLYFRDIKWVFFYTLYSLGLSAWAVSAVTRNLLLSFIIYSHGVVVKNSNFYSTYSRTSLFTVGLWMKVDTSSLYNLGVSILVGCLDALPVLLFAVLAFDCSKKEMSDFVPFIRFAIGLLIKIIAYKLPEIGALVSNFLFPFVVKVPDLAPADLDTYKNLILSLQQLLLADATSPEIKAKIPGYITAIEGRMNAKTSSQTTPAELTEMNAAILPISLTSPPIGKVIPFLTAAKTNAPATKTAEDFGTFLGIPDDLRASLATFNENVDPAAPADIKTTHWKKASELTGKIGKLARDRFSIIDKIYSFPNLFTPGDLKTYFDGLKAEAAYPKANFDSITAFDWLLSKYKVLMENLVKFRASPDYNTAVVSIDPAELPLDFTSAENIKRFVVALDKKLRP